MCWEVVCQAVNFTSFIFDLWQEPQAVRPLLCGISLSQKLHNGISAGVLQNGWSLAYYYELNGKGKNVGVGVLKRWEESNLLRQTFS